MFQQASRGGPVAPPARHGQRLQALAIDGLLLGLVALVIWLLLGAVRRVGLLVALLETTVATGPLLLPASLVAALGMALGIGVVYVVWCESSTFGATIGKACVGIRVVDARGRRPSTRRVVVRTLAKLALLSLGGLGFLPALGTRRHQAMHDLLSGTVVVRGGASREG